MKTGSLALGKLDGCTQDPPVMPPVAFPDAAVISDLLADAVKNVFTTMVSVAPTFKCKLTEAELGGDRSPFYKLGSHDPLIVGSIGFTGEANGVIYLYFESDTAYGIAATMTGMERAELEEESDIVNDVIGEISNMIVGNFKNGLCDRGFNCRVTVPTVLRGSHMAVDTINTAERTVFAFDYAGRSFVVDLFVQKVD